MKILITGCAGFIGFSVAEKLLKSNHKIYGIDNLNNYYDIELKKSRLKILNQSSNFAFFKLDISDKKRIDDNLKKYRYDIVIHMAAQAGVRFSISNPEEYTKSNLIGFSNIIDASKDIGVRHFIFASSSSVYGNSNQCPFTEDDLCNQPESFYAATKICNENIAFAYSNIHKLPCTGLRLFTVYGPYGRPDMAIYQFSDAIINNKLVKLFNKGNHERDFTYIDDTVSAITKLISKFPSGKVPYRILNIGSGKPTKLKQFLSLIERLNGKEAKVKFLKFQKGDVLKTHANITKLKKLINYKPKYSIESGLIRYHEWFKNYYK